MCVFAGAFRSWHGAVHLAAALARLHAPATIASAALFIGDGPERAAAERAARGVPRRDLHRARCRTPRCRRRWPPPTSASRRSIRRGTARCGSGSTGRR